MPLLSKRKRKMKSVKACERLHHLHLLSNADSTILLEGCLEMASEVRFANDSTASRLKMRGAVDDGLVPDHRNGYSDVENKVDPDQVLLSSLLVPDLVPIPVPTRHILCQPSCANEVPLHRLKCTLLHSDLNLLMIVFNFFFSLLGLLLLLQKE